MTQTLRNPITGTVIPTGYANLGVTKGFQAPDAKTLRMFLTAAPKAGKTTFVSSIPGALVLDFEKGADMVSGARAARIHVPDYDTYEKVFRQLLADGYDGVHPFNPIVFDTGDVWSSLIQKQKCKAWGVDSVGGYKSEGAGWSEVTEFAINQLVHELQAAGYGWIVTGHRKYERIRSGADSEMLSKRPALTPGIYGNLYRYADLIGGIDRTIIKRKVVEKIKMPGGDFQELPKIVAEPGIVLQLVTPEVSTGHSQLEYGPRIQMSEQIVLPKHDGWAAFEKAYNAAVEREMAADKQTVTQSE